jgi:hypothetical protein
MANTIKIADLEQALSKIIKDLDISVNVEDQIIDVYGTSNWGADNMEDYEKQEALIDEYKLQGECFSIYTWYDISGYDYWMKEQEEANYLSIGVNVWKSELTEEDIKSIAEAIEETDLYFINKLQQYKLIIALN